MNDIVYNVDLSTINYIFISIKIFYKTELGIINWIKRKEKKKNDERNKNVLSWKLLFSYPFADLIWNIAR